MLNKIDIPGTGHADEAPRYLKNVLARLRELPVHNREVWLKVIMSEFKQDFSHAKWREGYEQGKLEGMVEREKVKVKQFVADWYEEHKHALEFNIFDYVYRFDQNPESDFKDWLDDLETNSIQTLVNMHQFGYEVEKEKRYLVKVKGMNRINGCLAYNKELDTWYFGISGNSKNHSTNHTRKELEEAGFGWVFDCPGIEIEEVEG